MSDEDPCALSFRLLYLEQFIVLLTAQLISADWNCLLDLTYYMQNSHQKNIAIIIGNILLPAFQSHIENLPDKNWLIINWLIFFG